ncbi:MAG: YqjF family protein [Isosphaeraceae bacterium]
MMPAIDRLRPTREPDRRPVMRQSWRELLFLHWPIRPDLVRPLVPSQLELDLFEGTAYVGLVPFTMEGVRPVGLPPFRGISNFHETNVRTYVHREGRDPGVWFFSLDAANRLAVALARTLFHLPYYHARMFLEREPSNHPDDPRPILYAGVRRRPDPLPASYLIHATPTGAVRTARADTLEHFLVERYLLYAEANGNLFQGQVHHRPYPLQSATLLSLDETLLAAAGIPRPDDTPMAHFARGVDVKIYALEKSR